MFKFLKKNIYILFEFIKTLLFKYVLIFLHGIGWHWRGLHTIRSYPNCTYLVQDVWKFYILSKIYVKNLSFFICIFNKIKHLEFTYLHCLAVAKLKHLYDFPLAHGCLDLGEDFLDTVVVLDVVEIVDGTDGFDGVGTGWRLINHVNFWQWTSFCNRHFVINKNICNYLLWIFFIYIIYFASFCISKTSAPFLFAPTTFTWTRMFECLTFSLKTKYIKTE